jgi:hypothetical protein
MKVSQLVKRMNFQQRRNEPLPPWVQFPELPPFDMGWRMGSGQDFLEQVFWPFWRALSFADKTNYFEKYDLGPEWEDRDTWYSELTCGEFAFDEYAVEVTGEEVLERIIETTMEASKSIKSYKKTGPLWWQADDDAEVYVTRTGKNSVLHVDSLLTDQAEEFKNYILKHKGLAFVRREDGC